MSSENSSANRKSSLPASWVTLMASLLLCSAAQAAVPAAQASALGGDVLTPVGAERAGSKDGRIPAWPGEQPELMAKVADLGEDGFYPNLFASDKPLFRIDASNYQKYADALPKGAVKMVQTYKDYYINVYPTRRTVVYPPEIYAATAANAVTAKLNGVDTLSGASIGFPFPIPNSGAEVIWNHKVRYRGDTIQQTSNIITTAQDGSYQVATYEQTVEFFYGSRTGASGRNADVILKLLRKVTGPARLAGRYTLVIDKLDGSRDAWLYTPGTKRVLQAPTIAFDSPIIGSDGLLAADQSDMFNGSLAQYNWKLLGKRMMYIPYNVYALQQPELKLDDVIQPQHLNPKYMRYELHRVWVVEASMKDGIENQLHKRVFYVDEDSWTIAAVDGYDARNQLWEYQEGNIFPLLHDKVTVASPSVVYHLDSGRYVVQNLACEAPYLAKFGVKIRRGLFTPQYMTRLGGG